MRLLSPTVKLLAAATLPLALAACSSGSSGSSTSVSPAKATKDPDAGLMTGTQLKKALAPASFFASGFAADPSTTRDSGGTYAAPAAAGVTKPDCTKLGGTGWIDITGTTGVSFAQNDYVNKDTSEDIGQEIDVFRGTTATSVLSSLEKIITECPSYSDSSTHSTVKVLGKSTTGLGDAAYTITSTDTAWTNGTTLIAARVGTALVTVMSTDGHDNGAATAQKLTAQIVASLKSKA